MVAAINFCSSLDEFLASCPDRLFIAAVDGALLQWSTSFKETVGPALAQRQFTEIVHPEDKGETAEAWARVVETADPIELRIRVPRAGGGHQRFRCVLRLAPGGDFVHGSMDEDVEQVVHVDELAKLRQKEQILDTLMENVSICVWAIDTQGKFTYHDGKGLESAGVERSAFVGKSLFELYGDGDQDVRGALSGTFAHSFSHQHGRYWENWYVPVRDDGDGVAGVIGFTLDISEVKRAEEELRSKLALIEQQQQVIRDLSTPIIEVWDSVLTLPMVGVVDSLRASEVMDNLLAAIVDKRARFAILDLTGVDAVDTQTASYLVELVRAIRLLGAEGVITGIRSNVAQTMVSLGLDLSGVATVGNLRAGLRLCIQRMAAGAAPRAAASNGAQGSPGGRSA